TRPAPGSGAPDPSSARAPAAPRSYPCPDRTAPHRHSPSSRISAPPIRGADIRDPGCGLSNPRGKPPGQDGRFPRSAGRPRMCRLKGASNLAQQRRRPVIEAHALTKRYGPITAVDQLSFDVRPGVVTGFLGPNGSGKSTTMRLILGLDAADHDLPFPLREVGALLEAKAFYPGRSARAHLQAVAASNAIAPGRVDETL